MKGLGVAIDCITDFQVWLHSSGYGYLAEGVHNMDVGKALLAIANAAGVRGLSGSDSIRETLPMVRELIVVRCRPRWVM